MLHHFHIGPLYWDDPDPHAIDSIEQIMISITKLMSIINIDKVSQCASGGVWRNKSIVGGGGGGGGEDPDDGGDGDDEDNAPFDDKFGEDDEEEDDDNIDKDDNDDDELPGFDEAERSVMARAKRMKKKKTFPKKPMSKICVLLETLAITSATALRLLQHSDHSCNLQRRLTGTH
eukprot:scaffold125722_cov23-Cyclotella_meneghiniana.AAC.1